jgi:Family of unknown function (DUF6010)
MSAATAAGRAISITSHARSMTAGLVVGVVCVIPAIALSEPQGRLLLALGLAGIGWVYLGFAVADGRPSAIAAQAASASAFLWIAYAGVQTESTALLGAGFLAHGVWDAVHHHGHGPTKVRAWYPPFCVVADVAIAIPLLAGWL